MISASVPRHFTGLVSVFLIIQGIWELFSPEVFGVFSANTSHGIVHLFLGIVGIVSATIGRAVEFLLFLGTLLLIVGVMWFVPGTRHLPEEIFNVNRAVAIFNVTVGAVSLFVARDARRHRRLVG